MHGQDFFVVFAEFLGKSVGQFFSNSCFNLLRQPPLQLLPYLPRQPLSNPPLQLLLPLLPHLRHPLLPHILLPQREFQIQLLNPQLYHLIRLSLYHP